MPGRLCNILYHHITKHLDTESFAKTHTVFLSQLLKETRQKMLINTKPHKHYPRPSDFRVGTDCLTNWEKRFAFVFWASVNRSNSCTFLGDSSMAFPSQFSLCIY